MIISISKGSSFAQSDRYALEQKKNKERDPEKEVTEKVEPDRSENPSRDGHPQERGASGKDPPRYKPVEVGGEAREQRESTLPRGKIIGGNATRTNRKELTREFNGQRLLRTDVKKPVLQISVSAPRGEMSTDERKREIGEVLLNKLAQELSRKTAKKVNFEKTIYVIISHSDTEHDHFHIIVSRICFDGSLIPDSFERFLGQRVARDIEKEFGLKQP